MNDRCHDPIRKTPNLPGFYQKLLAGNALDKIKSFDTMLPEQWHSGPALSGEKAVLIALLVSALDDIRHRKRLEIEDLETWLTETDADSTARISFPRTCFLLGLSQSGVRRQLLAGIAHARELGLKDRRTHHRPWPKERQQSLPRVKMVSNDTDAILQGGM